MWNCNCSSWLKWCWEKYNSTAIGTFLWGLLTFILIINFIFLLWVGEECCASIDFFFAAKQGLHNSFRRGCSNIWQERMGSGCLYSKPSMYLFIHIWYMHSCINACDPTSHLVWSFDVELVRLTNEEPFKVLFRYDWFWPNEHTLPIYIYIHSICIFLWIQIYWKHVCNCSWFILHIEVQFSGFCFGSLGKVSFRIGKLKVWVGSVSESVRREHWIGLIWPSRVGFI